MRARQEIRDAQVDVRLRCALRSDWCAAHALRAGGVTLVGGDVIWLHTDEGSRSR